MTIGTKADTNTNNLTSTKTKELFMTTGTFQMLMVIEKLPKKERKKKRAQCRVRCERRDGEHRMKGSST
jgi:hypothetical protein